MPTMSCTLPSTRMICHAIAAPAGFPMHSTVIPALAGDLLGRLQPSILVLPLEAQAELNQARVKCIADLAHPALVEAVFRQLEVRMIEQVKELRAELHSLAFSDKEILQNGEILV